MGSRRLIRGRATPGWALPFGERDDVVRATCGIGAHADQARFALACGVFCANLHLVFCVGLEVDEGKVGERRLESETPGIRAGFPNANDIGQSRIPLGFKDVSVLYGKADQPGGAVPLDARVRLSSGSTLLA